MSPLNYRLTSSLLHLALPQGISSIGTARINFGIKIVVPLSALLTAPAGIISAGADSFTAAAYISADRSSCVQWWMTCCLRSWAWTASMCAQQRWRSQMAACASATACTRRRTLR